MSGLHMSKSSLIRYVCVQTVPLGWSGGGLWAADMWAVQMAERVTAGPRRPSTCRLAADHANRRIVFFMFSAHQRDPTVVLAWSIHVRTT